jgi:replicative DNA helicase
MNRHGETGRVRLHFDPKYQRWLDFDIAAHDWEVA